MLQIRILITFLLLGAYGFSKNSITIDPLKVNGKKVSQPILDKANILFSEKKFPEAIESYKEVLEMEEMEHAPVLKKVAQSYSALKDVDHSISYIEEYLHADFNTDVLADSWFDGIRETEKFVEVSEKYTPKFTVRSFLYLYVCLIGFYTAVVIQFNKKIDKVAKVLISSFIFIHSFFILHICFNITNYHYKFPHTYLMSTGFSFLYGPLLYFYFKRTTQKYQFRIKDLLHLLPTISFLIYATPIYMLPADEKFDLMQSNAGGNLNLGVSSELMIIVILKLISLMVYGFYIRRLYMSSKNQEGINRENRIWQRNIYFIHISYVFCYAAYGLLITNYQMADFLIHIQIICMAAMVMYIGYCANVQPSVFNGTSSFNKIFFKYEKSGLTNSLSNELKEQLIQLFEVEKIHKENDLNLEKISERLNTSRHNASQVINEHFDMNFNELVNKYRINEAKKIFHTDFQKNLNIIDVAYEVGFNNKVTFNKAFKKDTQVTPSEYQRTVCSQVIRS
ncbi:AraC family transcriptional regulator [Maribacter litopenaei]|uniref:AraC family transcriptional regulator n=1 Tax=Maribacter litopenaei TaxID=2976127 RepID=A0ABY5Y9T1_9FLAO|nr:helix-turn-helix domain-containing protein [Maribacter litopenaei]UWX55808.1 AraC family transcriptional regulator [Maribacter litopenaei]